MIKKLSILFVLTISLLLPQSVIAKSGYDAALEVAQAKRISNTIDNVNTIHKHINKYILQKAKLPSKNDLALDNKLFEAYNGEIGFTITNTKVNYTDIVPSSLRDLYKNSTSLNSLAVINDDMSMDIVLEPLVLEFLEQKANLTSDEISSLNSPVDTSKLWYQPNGQGGYTVKKHDGSNWVVSIANTASNIAKKEDIVVKSKLDLDLIKAKKGDKAYISKDKNSISGYIYDGSKWLLESAASSSKVVKECSAADIGVMKYDKDENCMQSCQAGSSGYAWECVKIGPIKIPIATSCYALKQLMPSLEDGVYTIDPDGKDGVDESFEVYCDMTTDGGGWTAIKYTYDGINPIVKSKSHLKTNYYLENEVTKKLLGISSTFLFKEDSSNTLGKLKDKAYPYIKNNIEKGFGWFKNTYGRDYLTAWITPIDGKNIPDAKQGSCDNFKTATYKYVFDSCNNGGGSHTALFSHMRMKGGSYSLKKQNMIFIGGGESNATIPKMASNTTTSTKSKSTSYYCPSGYSRSGSSCKITRYACPSGSSPWKPGTRGDCAKTVRKCPSSHPGASGWFPGYCYNGNNPVPQNSSCPPSSAHKTCGYRYVRMVNVKVAAPRVAKTSTTSLRSSTSCPSGYSASGSQCVKSVTTKTCPTGYKVSGSSCVLK